MGLFYFLCIVTFIPIPIIFAIIFWPIAVVVAGAAMLTGMPIYCSLMVVVAGYKHHSLTSGFAMMVQVSFVCSYSRFCILRVASTIDSTSSAMKYLDILNRYHSDSYYHDLFFHDFFFCFYETWFAQLMMSVDGAFFIFFFTYFFYRMLRNQERCVFKNFIFFGPRPLTVFCNFYFVFFRQVKQINFYFFFSVVLN